MNGTEQQKTDDKLELSNGWQNVGIMAQYARQKIDQKYRQVFMDIVQESFGYGMSKTLHKTQSHWAKEFGISERTFMRHINELALNGYVKINHQKGYIVGGGSKAYSYSPTFPRHANIWMKSVKKSTSKSEPEDNGHGARPDNIQF